MQTSKFACAKPSLGCTHSCEKHVGFGLHVLRFWRRHGRFRRSAGGILPGRPMSPGDKNKVGIPGQGMASPKYRIPLFFYGGLFISCVAPHFFFFFLSCVRYTLLPNLEFLLYGEEYIRRRGLKIKTRATRFTCILCVLPLSPAHALPSWWG